MNSYKFFGINESLHNKEYQSHYTYKTILVEFKIDF